MAVVAGASHSVTDFNDAPIVDLFVTPDQSRVQIFSMDNNSFTTDDWTSDPMILTPTVNVSGRTGNQVTVTDQTGDHVSAVRWFYVNSSTGARVQINASSAPTGLNTGDFTFVQPNDFDTTTTTFTGSIQDVARVLEVDRNIIGPNANRLMSTNIIRGGVVQLVCEIVYRSAIFGDITREVTIELQGQEQSGSTPTTTIESDRGNTFSPNQTNPIILTARLFLGGNEQTTSTFTGSFQWRRPLEGTVTNLGGATQGTAALNSSPPPSQTGTDAANYYVNQLIVERADVTGSEVYQCAIDADNSTFSTATSVTNTYSIEDLSDEYRVVTPNNLVIRAGATTTTGRYTIIRNGTLLQGSPGTGFSLQFRNFTDNGSGTLTQTSWSNIATATRLSGTRTGLTVTYATDNSITRGLMTITYGSSAASPAMQVNLQDEEITTVSESTTLIDVDLDDGT